MDVVEFFFFFNLKCYCTSSLNSDVGTKIFESPLNATFACLVPNFGVSLSPTSQKLMGEYLSIYLIYLLTCRCINISALFCLCTLYFTSVRKIVDIIE